MQPPAADGRVGLFDVPELISCSVSSFVWDPRFNRFAGTIREMVHACSLIDTLLSATPTCSQLFSLVVAERASVCGFCQCDRPPK